ncbi:MAG TPA: TIGR03668 family PPOX class F420-dependent oxidoreductase [Roseiflexaceae bacterium]|nr:TIGR03668 family PPOX class F420-dependent oxidoreductase [Roseiflexaceae bacterium]
MMNDERRMTNRRIRVGRTDVFVHELPDNLEEIMFTEQQRAFLDAQRVGRLATADAAGQPHVIPVCYACDNAAVYIALDAKPKRVAPPHLKRVRNVLENPQVALVVDRYSDDWSELAYVLIRGTARLIQPEDATHQYAVMLLRQRYVQYQTMPIHEQPMIMIEPQSVVVWGAVGG